MAIDVRVRIDVASKISGVGVVGVGSVYIVCV